MDKPAVLFLCTANSARSVMAEAFFRHEAGDAFDVASAGLRPRAINPFTVQVMREVGIDLEGREPRSVSDYLGRESFRYVVSVCKESEGVCPTVWPFAPQFLAWPFDDPAIDEGSERARIERFRTVRDAIRKRVRDWVAELKAGEARGAERAP